MTSWPTDLATLGPTIYAAGMKPALANIKNSTLLLSLAGSLLFCAAFPPLAWGWLAWIAPVPWLAIVAMPSLKGRHPYRILYLAGLLFWLLTLHWLRLPHLAMSIGWIALSAYLAVYLPMFVALSRVGVHSFNIPLWIAAPVVWTGLELARAHLLTGFLMAALSHTQFNHPALIQISDIFGAYGVSFLVMLVAATITSLLPLNSAIKHSLPAKLAPVAVAGLSLLAAILYGQHRIEEYNLAHLDGKSPAGPRVAIIQGNSLATWKQEPDKQQKIMAEYSQLSRSAVEAARQETPPQPVDLVIWPETMFRTSLVTVDEGIQLSDEMQSRLAQWQSYGPQELAALTQHLDTAVLVGIDRRHVLANPDTETSSTNADENLPIHAFNSSALVDANGTILAKYDKVHRVMFGEYVPLVKWIPFFDRIEAITGGIQAGTGPVAMELNGIRYAPNICYETVIPQVIRRQFVQLSEQGECPHVLVNLTNDAWYWGSSELDLHLACDVFRAVECRRPLVVAANGGLSALIDSCGRVLQQSTRQTATSIIAEVPLDKRISWYMAKGDWFAGLCLLCCVGLCAAGLWRPKT